MMALPDHIFISYDSSDRLWAEWIAAQLSAAGYRCVLGRDFRPSIDFIQALHEAIEIATHTVMVLSPTYLETFKTQPGSSAALAEDQDGKKGKLVLVRVRECKLVGVLAPFTFIDLVGLEEESEAREQLLSGLDKVRSYSKQVILKTSLFPPKVQQALVEKSEGVGKPRFPRHLPSLWYVTPRRNPLFTRRETILEKLYTMFHKEETGSAHPQALCGIGGIGKTQIAIEYAYRYRESYQSVLWASADPHDYFSKDFIRIAKLLYPEQEFPAAPQAISAVISWLETNTHWLLILDHVNDLANVPKFLPQKGKGHILLTTCSQATGLLAHPIHVEQMTKEEGSLFLLRRAKIIKADQTLDDVNPLTCETAEQLWKQLYGLPLALDQAGAAIEGSGSNLEEYDELFKLSPATCLKRRGKLAIYHADSVADTWYHSFEKLKRDNLAASELLLFCSFLSPHPVPEEIIKNGSFFLSPALYILVQDPFKWSDAIGELRKYSFIHRDAAARTLSLHPLLPFILKDKLSEDEHQRWEECMVHAVRSTFLFIDPPSRYHCQRYFVHLQVCLTYIHRRQMGFREALDLIQLEAVVKAILA